jgi:hypothetical protein
MNALSHKSIENNIEKFVPETITPPNSDSSLSKKGKTPPVKQAKRDKKSSELWRNKAIQKSAKIIAQTKTIAVIRKNAKSYKKQNKDLIVQFENLTLDLDQAKKNYEKKQEELLLSKTETINLNIQLEKAIEELNEFNKRIESFSYIQTNLQTQITGINTQVDNYNLEKLTAPKSTKGIEISKEIKEKIIALRKEVVSTEATFISEVRALKKQASQNLTLLKNSICDKLSNFYQHSIDYANEKIKELTKSQDNIKNQLESTNDRFKNKKNRQGNFRANERAQNYSYSGAAIRLTLLLITCAAISIRAAAKVMGVHSAFFDIPVPSYTIISEWAKKVGFYVYYLPKDKSVERIWIVDFSIQIGQDKLMLVLGIDTSKIRNYRKYMKGKITGEKNKLKICFQDVEVLHMVVLKSTVYEITLKELEAVTKKCGLPLFILSDEGSDLAKGVRIFIENNPGIKHLHDISHKLSNILKSILEKNVKWKEFCEVVTHIKQKLKLSDIAEICPPKFRQKVRYLNVRDPIAWAVIMLNMDLKNLSAQQKIKFNEYVKKPLKPFKEDILQWKAYVDFITFVETEIKHNGLTRGNEFEEIKSTSEILANYLKDQGISKTGILYDQIFEFVKSQEAKLSLGESMIASSDIIESMFGKWKSMVSEDSMAGITDMILLLPLLTVKLTDKLVIKALEDTPIKKIENWKKENLGTTMYAKRRAILHKKTSAKKDKKLGGEYSKKIKKSRLVFP